MIRNWNFVFNSVKCLQQNFILNRRIYFVNQFTLNIYYARFNTKVSVVQPGGKMNVFKFSDYDCIGFDLDNTLLRYNVTNMVHLEYETLAKFLIARGYDSKYLMKPLEKKDLDFIQKGLFLDFEKGNIIRISPNGIIHRACHGSRLLNDKEIQEAYPEQRWNVTDEFCKDMLSTWNGPLSLKMRSLLDYFDVSSSLIFARLVDTLDEKHGEPLNVYDIWPDMLDGLIEMFNREHFKLDKGDYFSTLKKYPEKYLHKCSTQTISWLKEMKRNHVTFLITGSNIDFANFTATYALGEDWKSLFDIVICYARKPGFFTSERPFFQILNNEESDEIQSKDLVQGKAYSQGNWKGLLEFLARIAKKNDPKCLYIGDNLLQDIYVPSTSVNCDTIAVIEEQMSEGMVHQGLSHPDDKILNSTFWGSYFCLTDSKVKVDSIWGSVIRNYAKLCVPEIDILAQQPLEHPYSCFCEDENKYHGYYPAVPLSISTL